MKLKNLRKPDSALKTKLDDRLRHLSAHNRVAELKTKEVAAKSRADLTLNPASGVVVPGRPTVTVKLKRIVTTDNEETQLTVAAQRLRKARGFFGRHLPVLACNNCSLSRVCPKFRAGYECAFLPFLHSHKVESTTDLVTYMKDFVGNSMRRAQLMNIIETANGGIPSVETSEALDMAFRQLKELHGVMTTRGEEEVTIEGDASLVGSIFGGMKAKKILEETREMKRVDPVLNLPKVIGAEANPILPVAEDIATELVRDAILGMGHAKKDLKSPIPSGIEVSNLH